MKVYNQLISQTGLQQISIKKWMNGCHNRISVCAYISTKHLSNRTRSVFSRNICTINVFSRSDATNVNGIPCHNISNENTNNTGTRISYLGIHNPKRKSGGTRLKSGGTRFYSAEPNQSISSHITIKTDHEKCNVTSSIIKKLNLKNDEKPLFNEKNPIFIIDKKIKTYLSNQSTLSTFKIINTIKNPIVHVKENFDDLLIPKDHQSRLANDTYYVDENHVLRTHTSAHQSRILNEFGSRDGSNETSQEPSDDTYNAFCMSADVYRRDEIDKSHYPVFHQMEGIRLFNDHELKQLQTDFFSTAETQDTNGVFKKRCEELQISETNSIQSHHEIKKTMVIATHLKTELEGLIRYGFINFLIHLHKVPY